ncbi:MAG: sterol desaturase family protein [Nocardioidaceae bacterium]|nr:sterol desaturase family protein [Nocardioidaceae bacterium]
MRSLVRFGYVPFVYLVLGGSAVLLAARHAPVGAFPLVVVAGVAVSFTAERLLPYDDSWNRDRGDGTRDVVHAVVNETLVLASLAVIPALAALGLGADRWPTSLPVVVQVLGAVLAADLGITLAHVASHRVPVLWRFHAVHHSVTRAYGFNGLMKHPVSQVLETGAGVLPLVLLGLPGNVAAALAACAGLQLLLQHSNVDYRVGSLRVVLALNEGHRFHHLRWAGVGDVNFGLFTLLWDHLLRTFSFDPGRRFSSDDLGMAAKPDYPVSWAAQMAEPFRASGACVTTANPAKVADQAIGDGPPPFGGMPTPHTGVLD